MNSGKKPWGGVLLLTLCISGQVVWAQKAAVVSVPFSFTVAAQELPAGRYSIGPNRNGNGLLVQSLDNKQSLNVPVLTRLSSRGTTKVELVFDKADGKSYLSEVYLPGSDGFHLQGAPGKHTHAKVEEP